MVLIGGIKYACERCIRGHRVTTCNHTDQPLMMIKPKGRPSSQCKHCKEMRKNKNSHSSGACTCGKHKKGHTGHSVNKHCGCDSGKPCMCHGKRKPSESKVSLDKLTEGINDTDQQHDAKVRQIGMDPLAAAKPATERTRTRVGEVSVPINEYIPLSSGGVGNVNDKLPEGFFRDVPLPFEPGHGLLDLFSESDKSQQKQKNVTDSTAPNSSTLFGDYNKRSSSTSLSPDSNHANPISPIEGINDFFPYFPMASTSTSTTTSTSTNANSNTHTAKFPHRTNSMMSSTSSTDSHAVSSQSTDAYHHHPHHYDSMIHKPGKVTHSKDTLFGSFERDLQQQGHQHHLRRSTDEHSARSVEVLSLTPTFMDLPEYNERSYFNLKDGGAVNGNQKDGEGQEAQSKSRENTLQSKRNDDMLGMSVPDVLSMPDGLNAL